MRASEPSLWPDPEPVDEIGLFPEDPGPAGFGATDDAFGSGASVPEPRQLDSTAEPATAEPARAEPAGPSAETPAAAQFAEDAAGADRDPLHAEIKKPDEPADPTDSADPDADVGGAG